MKMFEETITQKTMFRGNVVNLRVDDIKDCYGNDGKREVVEHNGGVAVIALDERENVLLVRQYRYAMGEIVLEIPAGKLEIGEEPLECGKRELTEETGYAASRIVDLGIMYPTPGYDTEKIYLYLAEGLTYQETNFDSSEFLTCEKIPLEQAVSMVLAGEIRDAKTQVGILKAWHILKKQKEEA